MKFTYFALSHSVSSIIVTGAMVATVVFSLAYSETGTGSKALVWAFSGYMSATFHLVMIVLHNYNDIPIDFYLPNDSAPHVPGSRMIGFGWSLFPVVESSVLIAACVLHVLTVTDGKKMSWLLVWLSLVGADTLLKQTAVGVMTSKGQYMVTLALCIHLIPALVYVVENSSSSRGVTAKKTKKTEQ